MDETSNILAMLFAPGFHTIEGFSKLLGTDQDQLLKLIYPERGTNYLSFSIKKKNGTPRQIRAPKKKLKSLQRVFANYLQGVYRPKPSAHGFLPNRSVKSNAAPHTNKSFVFNIDLKDFFETIHFGRVRNLFMSKPFSAPQNVASVAAHLCCYNGRLAQGAPTSPIISNMIALKLDTQLQTLAARKKCHYTRYADDITFSFTCSKHRLPTEIVQHSDGGFSAPGEILLSIVEKNGFSINAEKTRLQHRTQRQVVTGLTVNKFPNLSREYFRLTGSMINALKKYGAANAEKRYIEILSGRESTLTPRASNRVKDKEGTFFVKVIEGRLNYIQMIRGRSDPIYRRLAYFFSLAIGKERVELSRTAEDSLSDSIFVVDNDADISQGTAFLLSGVGIVTNYHVVELIDYKNSKKELKFTTTEVVPRELRAELIYANKDMDLAIFYPGKEFEGVRGLHYRKSCKIKPLDPILAIGFPSHAPGAAPFMNTGKVIQSRILYNSFFWIVDIGLISGNSGGPIFNSSMEVIGVATRGAKANDMSTVFNCFLPITDIDKMVGARKYLLRRSFLEFLFPVGKGLRLIPAPKISSILSCSSMLKKHVF
ncbi:reverse transcriptase domain-containing protein [Pseudomonas sp. NPDC099000]|uniref:reverse transcriptase domain-containing protein n=1 Tax=Pseudomonas sp. NPDC099000 TaxID=3364488 RepID=UPI003839F320